jgi:opacity protein-like surface antigen
MWSFMPGLYFKYNIHNFYFLANASMGVVHASTPQISVFVEDGGNPDGTFTQETSTATSVGIGGGAGIGYTLFSNVSINVTANYVYSQPVFFINNTDRTTNTGRLITNYSEPLQAFNLVFGIGYAFGK